MEVSETHTESTLLQQIKTTVLTLAVFALVIFLAIFFMGSQSQHRDNHNFLYDCFDTSSDHASLLSQLSKSRLSILFGRKEAGLFQFAQHYANNLSLAGRNVFVEDISKKQFKLYRVAAAARTRLDKWLGLQKEKGDWFIYSQDGSIVGQDIIDKIRKGNPNSKIFVVTTSARQRNAGFKEFRFPEIDEHEIQESIQRNFKVSQNTADILYDYFETAENAFRGMNFEIFSHEAFLGDNYRSLEGLSKEDNRIIKDLCKKGEGHSEAESLALTELGIIFHRGENYWRNPEARLNYELHKGLNCKNKLFPQHLLAEVQELREREAEERRKREEKIEEIQRSGKGKEKRGRRGRHTE